MIVPRIGREIDHALRMVRTRVVDTRRPRRDEVVDFSNCARRLAKRASANRRKIRPRTGVEYCAEVRPELARS